MGQERSGGTPHLVYRGDNYGGVMAPAFFVVFSVACVYMVVRTVRGDGPPLWFTLSWVSLVVVVLGLTTTFLATKITVGPAHITWSYLGRRGGSAPVEDIESVRALGWAMPGYVRLTDGRRIWIQTTPGFRDLREVIAQVNPDARV